jgi:CRISPR-associated endonuclease/helicase Cas3
MESAETYFRYWGKADPRFDGEPKWHPLVYHCLDVAACGQKLLQAQPAWLQTMAGLCGVDPVILSQWLVFLLAIHDIGKAGDGFQSLRPDLQLELQGQATRTAYDLRHDTLGYALAMESLPGWLGRDASDDFEADLLRPWLAAVAGHHGRPPKNLPTKAIVDRHFRTPVVDDVRQFIDESRLLFFPAGWCLPEPAPGGAEQQQRASWLVAGFAVLSDWLGSNTRWFKYQYPALSLEDYWHIVALPTAQHAVQESGLVGPPPTPEISFAELFPRIASTSTPLQTWANAVAIAPGPHLFVLEELTGGGKTEGGLTLAARLMSEGAGRGIYFALPTMATADAMFDRLRSKREGDADETWRRFFSAGEASLILAHSAAATKTKLDRMQQSDAGYDNQREEPSASQHSTAWLADSRKKALLADFGVGTVDQALLGVLPLRHQSLRLLGLSTKILVVDEVHACDCYMSELLARLLRFHAGLGGSAILLSATLPIDQRAKLLAAFAEGAGYPTSKPDEAAYPLATHLHSAGLDETPIQAREAVSRPVAIDSLADEAAVFQRLEATLQRGGCTVWVRNTVADATVAWQTWNARHPDTPAILFHARFALCDRLEIAETVKHRFGPDSTAVTRGGRLVVATQVVEQSLDVDFDDMVTDLAPIDLVVQRAGRLQRHARDATGNLAPTEGRGGARLGVLMPEPTPDAAADWFKGFLSKAARVYPDHGKLWLTAHWLVEHGGFDLAAQARDLIESVYGDTGYDRTPAALRAVTAAAEGACHADRGTARGNLLSFEQGYDPTGLHWPDEDDHADITTRLGEKTVRLRLAKIVEDDLIAWANADPGIAWPLSELTVARRLVAGESPRETARIERARQSMPDQGRYCLIVPLEQCGTELRGWAMNQQDQDIRVIYSSTVGLRIEKGDALDESDL